MSVHKFTNRGITISVEFRGTRGRRLQEPAAGVERAHRREHPAAIATMQPAPLCLDPTALTPTGRDIVSAVVSFRAAASRARRARRDGRPASRHLACARSANDTIRGLLPFTVPGRSRLLDALTAESQWWDDGRFGPFYRQQLRQALAEVLTAYRTHCCATHGQPCQATPDGQPCCDRCPQW